MNKNLSKIIARVSDTQSADVSLKDVRTLAQSRDPEAIDTLAGLLDDTGRVGREAARALTRFGRDAESTLRRCLVSMNETVRAQAHELLAALGEVPARELTPAEAVIDAKVDDAAPEPDEAKPVRLRSTDPRSFDPDGDSEGHSGRPSTARRHQTSGSRPAERPTMNKLLHKIIARIEDSASRDVSLKDIRVLAKSRDPEVIDTLAGLLEDTGRVGREAARALTRFGRDAEPTLRRCVVSLNETVRAHAHTLLAALGESRAEEPPVRNHALAIEPDNDNQDERAVDYGALEDPELTRAIRATLYARGVRVADIPDAIQEVFTRVLEAIRFGVAPQSFDEWKAFANKVAERYAVDVLRKRGARDKQGDELCEDPDAFAEEHVPLWDPIEAKRMVDVFTTMLEDGELPELAAEIIDGKVDGLTDAEIGAELGVHEETVKTRRALIRGRFAWQLANLGMAALVPSSRGQKRDEGGTPKGSLRLCKKR